MTYLSAIPTLKYNFTVNSDPSAQVYAVPDILTKVGMYLELPDYDELTDSYLVLNSETPEQISYKLYGDPQYHWTILYINNITDMGSEWPVPDAVVFYLVENPDVIHHYEYRGLTMDLAWITAQYGAEYAIPVTNLDYAVKENDVRRGIKVLSPSHLGTFVQDFMAKLST